MGFNVLFDSESMGESAMAVTAPTRGAAVHFLCPSRHGVWAGTAHLPRPPGAMPSAPTAKEIERFVGDLRNDVPDFAWSSANVRKVYSGFVPVREPMTVRLAARPDVIELGSRSGLFGVVGVKYTTAVQVATRALRRALETRLPSYSSGAAATPMPAADHRGADERRCRGCDAASDAAERHSCCCE